MTPRTPQTDPDLHVCSSCGATNLCDRDCEDEARALPDPTEPRLAELRSALMSIAARIVRLNGGCESGHRAGRWHIHEEPFHSLGRDLASLLHRYDAGLRSGALPDPTEPLRACDCGITGLHSIADHDEARMPDDDDDDGNPLVSLGM